MSLSNFQSSQRSLFTATISCICLLLLNPATVVLGATKNDRPQTRVELIDAFLCDESLQIVQVQVDGRPPVARAGQTVRICFQKLLSSSSTPLTDLESFTFSSNELSQQVDVSEGGTSKSSSHSTTQFYCTQGGENNTNEKNICVLEAIVDGAFFRSGRATVEARGMLLSSSSLSLSSSSSSSSSNTQNSLRGGKRQEEDDSTTTGTSTRSQLVYLSIAMEQFEKSR